MVRHRQGGAPGSLARGAVAVATAWALAWAGVPVPVMALQDEGQAQKQAQAQAEEPPGESPAPAEVVAPQADEAAGASVSGVAEGDEATGVADAAPAVGLQTAEDNIASGTCGECSWVIDSEGTLTVTGSGKLAEMGEASKVPWRSKSNEIKAVVFGEGVVLPSNCGQMFGACSALETIDVSGWDTSEVTNMAGMFSVCNALKTLDVSNWKTGSVTNMSGMFSMCGLTELNVSGWDTSSVTDMSYMFYMCPNLSKLDVSKWVTSNVTSTEAMFVSCAKLYELDLSGWDTSSVTKSSGMFADFSPVKIIVGSGYKMADKSIFPEPRSGFYWESKVEGDPFSIFPSASDVVRSRSGVAATYNQVKAPTNISGATVSLSSTTYTYDGKAKTPAVTVILDGKTLVQGTDYSVTYVNNVNPGTARVNVVGRPMGYTGVATAEFKIVDARATRVDMYRLYNPYSGEHFYTASADEKNHLAGIGWNYEGVGWVAPKQSNTPVYRLYNPYAGDHHYTTSAEERDQLKAVGWNDEGVGWYSDDAKGVPLYRQYNPYATVGTHNYTTSKEENDGLVAVGWRAEGIGWYGMK